MCTNSLLGTCTAVSVTPDSFSSSSTHCQSIDCLLLACSLSLRHPLVHLGAEVPFLFYTRSFWVSTEKLDYRIIIVDSAKGSSLQIVHFGICGRREAGDNRV